MTPDFVPHHSFPCRCWGAQGVARCPPRPPVLSHGPASPRASSCLCSGIGTHRICCVPQGKGGHPIPQNPSLPSGSGVPALSPVPAGTPGPAAAEGAGGQLQRAPGFSPRQVHPGTLRLPVSCFSEVMGTGGVVTSGLGVLLGGALGMIPGCPGTPSFAPESPLPTFSGRSSSAAGKRWGQGRFSSSAAAWAWVVGAPRPRPAAAPCLSFPTAVLTLPTLLRLQGCSYLRPGAMEKHPPARTDGWTESSEPAWLVGWGIPGPDTPCLASPQPAAVGG